MTKMVPRIPNPDAEAEARSLGPANENESVSPVEREGAPRSEMSDGPNKLGNNSFGPARYKLPSGNICEDR